MTSPGWKRGRVPSFFALGAQIISQIGQEMNKREIGDIY